ncbi:alpha/beta fold hydrolase [Pseudonocardia benzenivorans]
MRLAYRELGAGRPTVLLHGFSSTAPINWVTPGHAAAVAATGRRVILPDLRGHGDSDRSHDPRAYPADVLTDDVFALLDHLGLADGGYDLGGYSLGARTSLRAVVRGARPGRLVVAGMGLAGVVHIRGHSFADVFTQVLDDAAPPAGTFAPASRSGASPTSSSASGRTGRRCGWRWARPSTPRPSSSRVSSRPPWWCAATATTPTTPARSPTSCRTARSRR